jgi:hypothetical protein
MQLSLAPWHLETFNFGRASRLARYRARLTLRRPSAPPGEAVRAPQIHRAMKNDELDSQHGQVYEWKSRQQRGWNFRIGAHPAV